MESILPLMHTLLAYYSLSSQCSLYHADQFFHSCPASRPNPMHIQTLYCCLHKKTGAQTFRPYTSYLYSLFKYYIKNISPANMIAPITFAFAGILVGSMTIARGSKLKMHVQTGSEVFPVTTTIRNATANTSIPA